MGDASEVIAKLRPVLFHYRQDVVGESEARVLHYGLIAEEVAAVAPELVTYDDEGKPNSVQYRLLTPLLLNEMQEQQRTIEGQGSVIEKQHQVIATLSDRLDAVEQTLVAKPTGTDR